MTPVNYDKYYQTENLFGAPYPELIAFFQALPKRGKLLDLGCGQGRDALPLARLGFDVTGVDHSQLGIQQMMRSAQSEGLPVTGIVADVFKWNDFANYQYILLDSMFHFTKKDRAKETAFIRAIISQVGETALVAFCIQDTGEKWALLNRALDAEMPRKRVHEVQFKYLFHDRESGHSSESNYRMLVVKK